MLRQYTAYFVVECSGYDSDTYTDAGFYPAASFSEAIDYLEEFYGSELVVIKHLELLDTSLVVMKPEIAAEVVANIFS